MVKAINKITSYGPKKVIIKKGAHGSIASYDGQLVCMPAFPVEDVYDPTGAGDSFAGGVMGYLASCEKNSFEIFCKAIAYGTVVASFTVERFSLDRLREISRKAIDTRLEEFKKIVRF